MFPTAPVPSQEEVEALVEKVSKRILRLLQRRGVITLVTAPGDGEVTVVTDETMAEKDPLLAKLLAAATSGTGAAGSANRRQQIRIVLAPDERPVGQGTLCGQSHGFNLQNATRVAANDKEGRERLCRYILRPPLANDRLKVLDEGSVRLDFKRPWSDGTSWIELAPLAVIGRPAALVPLPRRHTVLYCGPVVPYQVERPLHGWSFLAWTPLSTPPPWSRDPVRYAVGWDRVKSVGVLTQTRRRCPRKCGRTWTG